MEAAKNTIYCPVHPSEPIQRVNMEFGASQDFFCIDCLLNLDSGVDKSQIKTINDFLEIASNYYVSQRQGATRDEEIPGEYQEILVRQSESIEEFSQHIEKEKKRIQDEFDKILESVTKTLVEKRDQLCHELDRQLLIYRHNFAFFEKQLKKAYPQDEDDALLYPSKDELLQKYAKINNHIQLMVFVKNIREDLNESKLLPNETEEKDPNKLRKEYIKKLAEDIKETNKKYPTYSLKDISSVNETVTKEIESITTLENSIPELSTGGANSAIFFFDPKGSFSQYFAFLNNNRTVISTTTTNYVAFAKDPLPKGRITTFNVQLGSITYYVMIGITPANQLSNRTCYSDSKSIGYGQEGKIYGNGPFGLQKLNPKDKVTVIADLVKGNITFLINKKQVYQGKIKDYQSTQYYPFVYMNCASGIEATFV